MEFATILLLAGAVTAIAPPHEQQVFGFPEQIPRPSKNVGSEHLHRLQDVLQHPTEQAQAIWDEVSMMYPEDMAKASLLPPPKAHSRRPDHHWDHIVRGSDIEGLWVDSERGEKERELSGKLDTYDLRVKKVDPSALQVDPGVKQYSGYLDDNEHDKHLFYCENREFSPPFPGPVSRSVLALLTGLDRVF